MKIKTAFIKYINEPKQVNVVWIRGKRSLESAIGTINPETHEAKIEDVFKMKTSFDYNIEK